MSIEKVRAYFRQYGIEDRVREVEESSATVEAAAMALGRAEKDCQDSVLLSGRFRDPGGDRRGSEDRQ